MDLFKSVSKVNDVQTCRWRPAILRSRWADLMRATHLSYTQLP